MKPKRWIAISDTHGDRCDVQSVEVMFDFMNFWKPDIRVHMGDLFDLRALRKKASDEERQEGIAADVSAGLELMKRFNATHWLRGNHDERLWDAAQSRQGTLSDYAKLLIDQIIDSMPDTVVYPYEAEAGVLRLGHLKLIHGYHQGLSAARQAALVYGSVLMGHVHTIDEASIAGLERRVGRIIGCLCQRRMDYNRAMPNTLRQAHGFAYGLLHNDGSYTVFQAEAINGQWYLPSEIKNYARSNTRRDG